MGIIARISHTIRVRVNSLLDKTDDPTKTLDYSYEQYRNNLQDVKDGLTKVTTQKKRLEIKKQDLEKSIDKHNKQARQAVKQGREDLAERALQKKKTKMEQVESLEGDIQKLQRNIDDMVETKNELESKIEQFRTEKETMKARYEAAQATEAVNEAMTGIGDEGEVGDAIDRIEEEIEDKEARSEAINELREEGELEGVLGDESQIDEELNELTKESAVANELEAIKAEVNGEEIEQEPEQEEPELETEMEVDVESETETETVTDELADLEDDDVDGSHDVTDELENLKDEENAEA